MRRLHHLLASTLATMSVLLMSSIANAAITFDEDVTPEFINGSGNINGSFTVDRANGVEIGLRGKLRHNAMGQPENTFNSNGDGTYTFEAGVAPTQNFPTAEWSYEWSINTNFDGSSNYSTLGALTYVLSLDTDPGVGVNFYTFDPIHGINPNNGLVFWDHAMGNNSTGNGAGVKALTEPEYAANIGIYNVAQQSWKPQWHIPGFDPTTPGEYTISLTAYDGAMAVASSSIVINAIPEPGSIAMMGLAGLFGTAVYLRRRWA